MRKIPEEKPEAGNLHLEADEEALMEEIHQLRAAIKIYRELVERLMLERDHKP